MIRQLLPKLQIGGIVYILKIYKNNTFESFIKTVKSYNGALAKLNDDPEGLYDFYPLHYGSGFTLFCRVEDDYEIRWYRDIDILYTDMSLIELRKTINDLEEKVNKLQNQETPNQTQEDKIYKTT